MRVRAVVPWSVRFPTMANHTATHLLHKALQDVLGEHARQAGSAVRPDKLRFDFTPSAGGHRRRSAREIERRVNEAIFRNLPVRAYIVPIEEARRLGAMMLFGEKYGDEVRLVDIAGYSRELCGGTHVRATAEIGPFVITSESSVGSGTRRIEAVTSGEAYALLHGRARRGRRAARPSSSGRGARGRKRAEKVEVEVEPRSEEAIGGVNVFVGQAAGVDADALLEESDRIKQARAPAAVVLGAAEDGRVHLVANFDQLARGPARRGRRDQGGGGRGRRRRRRAGDDGARRRPRPREARRRAREGRGGAAPGARVKVVALDYGSARTGVAVSDPTGTIARPLGVVERAGERGRPRSASREIVRDEGAERVVVGLPLTLRGEHGAQARETDAFVEALRAAARRPGRELRRALHHRPRRRASARTRRPRTRAPRPTCCRATSRGRAPAGSDAAAAAAAEADAAVGGLAPPPGRARRARGGLRDRLVRGRERRRQRQASRRRPTVAAPPKPFRIVFPEGFTREQMAARVTAVAQIAERERGKRVRLKAQPYLAATARPRRQPGFGAKALPARGLPLPGDLRLHRARRPRRSSSPRS